MYPQCWICRVWAHVWALCLPVLLGLAGRADAQHCRGIWADVFSPGFKSVSQIDTLVNRAVTGRYNAIFAEVLGYHDAGTAHGAYWNSSIVPKATDIASGLDPLAYLCQKANENGIEVHAWLIPFRACSNWPPTGNAILTANPHWFATPYPGGSLVRTGDFYMLDPGSPDVQDYLVSIVREIVTNYPVSGIHWDYIRYVQTDAGYPSDYSYYNSGLKRFQRIYNTSIIPVDGHSQWGDFRRRTIDELIRRCRAEIPTITSNPRQPVRLTAAVLATGSAPANFSSSLAFLRFQNWQLWMQNGWLDANVPMNYKQEHCNNEASMYRSWVDASINWRYARHTFCGQGTYLNTFSNSLTQKQYALNAGANGVVSYSYNATRSAGAYCDAPPVSDSAWWSYIATNLFTAPATMPTMPWRNPATATEGTVWGRVKNWDTNTYVDNATVTVSGRPPVYTDGNGYYVVTLVPATAGGTNYTITASMPGASLSRPNCLIRAGEVVRFDFTFNAPPPFIAVSPESFSRSVQVGGTLPVEYFQVWNANDGDMSFTVSSNVTWLDVWPLSGLSTGPSDKKSIGIAVSTGGLNIGTYQATITVTAPSSTNGTRTISYTLEVTVPVIPADMDSDGDVDLSDFGAFQLCLSGSGVPRPAGCAKADLDNDNDVDQIDRARFQGCISGSGILGNPNCLN